MLKAALLFPDFLSVVLANCIVDEQHACVDSLCLCQSNFVRGSGRGEVATRNLDHDRTDDQPDGSADNQTCREGSNSPRYRAKTIAVRITRLSLLIDGRRTAARCRRDTEAKRAAEPGYDPHQSNS